MKSQKAARKKTKPEVKKANILKIVPSSGHKKEPVNGPLEDNESFIVSHIAKLEDRVRNLEYFAEVVGRSMSTQQTNLAAFNSTLKKIYPQI